MRYPPPWLFRLLLILTVPLSSVPAAVPYKLQLNDPALAGQVTASGGQLLANYGGYQLYTIAQLPPVLATNAQVTLRDQDNLILLNAARLDTTRPEVKALRHALGTFSGKRLHLIQFIGPVQPVWYQALLDSGAQVVAYVPHNAYLLYGDASALGKVQALAASADFVQWEGPFADDYKIHPAARNTAKGLPRVIGTDRFTVQLIAEPDGNVSTLQLLDQLKLEPFPPPQSVLHYRNVFVRLSPDSLASIAARPDVVSIQPFFTPRKFDERQDQIVAGNLSGTIPSGPGYLAWLASKGFTQAQFTSSGFVVDLSDSGIDNGTTTPNHLGLHVSGALANPGRVAYNRLEGTPNGGTTLAGCDGHGNLNAHVIAGYNAVSGFPHSDNSGFHYGLGVCPFVKVGSSVIFDPDFFTYPDFNNLQSEAYESGARISNNSWGGVGSGSYDAYAQTFDALVRDAQPDGSTYSNPGNQEMVLVFSAGNDGPADETVGSPGLAKNVIGVGAANNVQGFGGNDGCGVPDLDAQSANDIAPFSSRGHCPDGRHKPDLVAPGTHVSGGVIQADNPGPNGTADPCFLNEWNSGNSSVCGSTNGDAFWPAGQQFYTASSGTSHSAPAVAGACALVRQYFLNNFTNPPSPAMTKAFLMNSARYLTGAYGNDSLWSDTQGMGEMNLGMAFDGTQRLLRDELTNDLFTASGQSHVFTGSVVDTNKPFRVTLAWSDAPGEQFSNPAYKNNLDLVVTAGGNTYLGNVFEGAFSATGGTADPANNVESVFLPAGLSGSFSVKIIATDINSDGVPGNASPLDQDFALVIYNASTSTNPAAVVAAAGAVLVAESCSPTNGVADPGETVSFQLALENFGTAPTTNLTATLLTGGGVVAPSGPQTYGVLTPWAGAVSRPFSFTASAVCGGTVTATLRLQDGAATLPPVQFSIPLGAAAPVTSFAENFDALTPPALPARWATSASGGGFTWATSSNIADTPPNSVYVPDASTAGVGELVSPVIPVVSSTAQLTFNHYYDLEQDTSPGFADDGGVLELSIAGGAFTDILSAGGSFLAGGYNLHVGSSSNPLVGRAVWSGNSGGFIPTVVRLPSSAAGQNVQLKWRVGTDLNNINGGTGWYLDTISIQDLHYSCCTSSVAPPYISGINVTRSNVVITSTSLAGGHYTLQYKNALTDTQWLPIPAPIPGTGNPISLIDTNAPGPRRFYRVLAN